MKVKAECAACALHRGYLETEKATDKPSLQFKTMSALINFLTKEFKPTAVAAYLGTQRDKIIKEVTGNPDPYAKTKQISNQRAMEILPSAKNIVLNNFSIESRFRKTCLCSIVGNIMEFDIPHHDFKFEDLEKLFRGAEEDLAIDEIPEIFNQTKKAKKIIFLTDNAGEIAFDTLLVQELKKFGANVTVAVKSKPVLNDATMEDAKYVGMHNVADKVVTTGSDSVGLILEDCSKEFLKLYNSANFVVAKGMGHAETLTELNLEIPHALLLRTKCRPVANYFGVDRNKNVAKMMMP